MDDPNKKGVSIKEIENFTKNHRLEIFFFLSFLLACLFSWAFFGTGWSIILATIGAILGLFMTGRVEFFTKKMWHFIFKQEPTIQIVLGVVCLIISIFLPPVIFFMLGLEGGKTLYHSAMETKSQHKRD